MISLDILFHILANVFAMGCVEWMFDQANNHTLIQSGTGITKWDEVLVPVVEVVIKGTCLIFGYFEFLNFFNLKVS